MVLFYKNELGFTMELKTSSSFKTTGLLQPWQTLCKIFSKCLTTRVTGWDQPPLQIMQMMYCFINNIHVDYAELLWEGLHYSLHHPTSSIPYPRFTKIIISHYMTNFPEISRRVRDRYHNLKDDDIMKNIFNSGRHKDRVGMKIPDWMISEEMKHTEHYRMYAEVFGIDVPLTQSQPTESTQGTHRTPIAPRSPKPNMDAEQEARENVELVNKHLASVEIEKMVEGSENTIDDSSIPRNDDQNILGTRLEPRVNKESPEEEITDEVYELKQREKGKIVEQFRNTPFPTPLRSPRIHTDLVSSDTEKLQELTEVTVESLPTMVDKHIKEQVKKQVPEQVKVQVPVYVAKGLLLKRKPNKEETNKMIAKAMLQEHRRLQAKIQLQIQQAIDNNIPSLVDASVRNYMSGHILHVHPAQPQTPSVLEQQYQLSLAVRPRDQDDPHDDAPPEGENSNQEQVDDYDFWTESYASDDDEIPMKQVSQDIMEEVSLTIDEAELKKIKSDIVWESRKEILASLHPRNTTPLVQSCPRDPEAPALSLINQDLLYLKKGNSGPEKIVLSLHKFPAIIFNDVDIEERTSRWVNKYVKKFNHYARYGVEHWKNPHAKIFYIKRQKEPGKPKEVVYSNSKIIQVIKTYWELGHEHKFITEIVARRANECIVSITELDYKNLNKNDIKDMYLLIMNGKSYNNDVKYGYIQIDLTEDEVEYLKLFKEEIEVSQPNEKMGDVCEWKTTWTTSERPE
ncbi:hypothetical protein Tco_0910863 [Tanacetum coccineum]|uniref:Uncharacterized protein n=1 Tax=Tanacetum coccineum TaxID=301880 RepID=A0ABQ5CWA3_9ASTR